MNNRRKLLVVLGASVITASLASFAQQQSKVWRVGYLSTRSRPDSLDSDTFGAFRKGMSALGYVEGKNLIIEWRFADGKVERFPELAAELVQLKMDVIVAGSTPATSAAQKATTTIPIVMGSVDDPVNLGFVKSLAHPGGNITGLSNINADLSAKHLEMLLNIVSKLSLVAVMVNPSNSAHATVLKNIQTAAQRIHVNILAVAVEIRTAQGIENAFSIMARQKAQAVIVVRDAFFNWQARQIAQLAAKNRLPSVSASSQYVEAGGLMSYGPNLIKGVGRAAIYVDKIFKGAKPGDLPVEQPTKLEMFINGKTAKALGLTIPQSLLIMADRVIE